MEKITSVDWPLYPAPYMPIFNYKKHPSHQGSALISALCIMAIVAIAATTLSLRVQLESYRAQLTFTYDKLSLAAQAVSFWAMDAISNTAKKPWVSQDNMGKVLTFPEKWQTIYPETRLSGALYDLQSRFNVNNLINRNFHPVFLRLLDTLTPPLATAEKQVLLANIFHWINPPQEGQGQTPQTAIYLTSKPPYLPSQQFMAHLSELRLVKGMEKRYQSLTSVTTALPEETPINLNTASARVVAALGKGLGEDGIGALLKARGKKGFKTTQAASPLLKKYQISPEQITLESSYFLSVAVAENERMKLTVYTVLKREWRKKAIKISIVSQTINTG